MPKTKAATKLLLPDKSDIKSLLQEVKRGKTSLTVRKGKTIFCQGGPSDAIYFIEKGRVKISVISPGGKEAVLAMLGPPSFIGEGCMVGQSARVGTATALETSTLLRIDKDAMLRALSRQPQLSGRFIASLLTRNIDLEEDLCDQFFNHSEKRLARVLIKLARLSHPTSTGKLPILSHEILAEMVGTTRSRITHFMNKFRKLGLIEYNGELFVRAELLTDLVLHD